MVETDFSPLDMTSNGYGGDAIRDTTDDVDGTSIGVIWESSIDGGLVPADGAPRRPYVWLFIILLTLHPLVRGPLDWDSQYGGLILINGGFETIRVCQCGRLMVADDVLRRLDVWLVFVSWNPPPLVHGPLDWGSQCGILILVNGASKTVVVCLIRPCDSRL